MIDFIPLEHFAEIYFNVLLIFTLLCLFHSAVVPIHSKKNLSFINFSGYFLFFSIVLYLGLRPISGKYFGDTRTYATYFEYYANGGAIVSLKDVFFHVYMKFCSAFMNVHIFFTLCDFLYIFPLYKISKTLFKEYWFYALFMFIISFSFYTYGTNGIRNGLATSFFLWGICYHKNKIFMGLFFLLSASFHKTMYLPIIAYIITHFYNDPKRFLQGWLMCIPLSLALSSVWISLFSSLGFADDRLSSYLSGEAAEGTFSSTGFRWDFLFHSSFAVVAGWYFIYKKQFVDKLYFQLFNTYLLCNGFWILVIKANFSNRFAYLSWFMMGLIIIYPFLKQRFFQNQHLIIAKVMLIYFMFTYLMFYIY
ncbi:EpsG family protein [Flavivirga rizhaonensis]|uniref:EpsG family protein n=1 Tax=Flavivirga rizhaonensis TaxID=2559571 RepID=A0A4S1E0G6_9FLAO|nr:EpsG family protein [Flavivirga rizhaonensis]TGV03949.1 EpsG family protein [Flavivirga rizhaonensis]